ncbi:MAG: DUF4852 domain-containing protein [Alphaproteobacteria bacterium]|nr:DUF4852 domain-containing protein [Alphaproteobacteria bacterium]
MVLNKSSLFVMFALVFCLGLLSGQVYAQDANKKVKPTGPVLADFSEPEEKAPDSVVQLEDLPPDVPVADFVEGTPQSTRKYIYEKATLKNLSNLYWAMGYADLANDQHIDHYLKITECEIFRKFVSSEFEMKEIREATRKFIVDNRNEFSTRFELVQEILLRDYDLKRRAFKIDPRYQIQSVRRFELVTSDNIFEAVCGQKGKASMIFPPGLILEFSRPFTLTYIPVPDDIALAYIEEKNKRFQKILDKAKSQEKVYEYRKAYLVLYAKAFAFRKLEPSTTIRGAHLLQTMAALEGVEVYGDPGRKQLFYSKSFLSNKSPTEVSEQLLKEYAVLKEKYKAEGMFH